MNMYQCFDAFGANVTYT